MHRKLPNIIKLVIRVCVCVCALKTLFQKISVLWFCRNSLYVTALFPTLSGVGLRCIVCSYLFILLQLCVVDLSDLGQLGPVVRVLC